VPVNRQAAATEGNRGNFLRSICYAIGERETRAEGQGSEQASGFYRDGRAGVPV